MVVLVAPLPMVELCGLEVSVPYTDCPGSVADSEMAVAFGSKHVSGRTGVLKNGFLSLGGCVLAKYGAADVDRSRVLAGDAVCSSGNSSKRKLLTGGSGPFEEGNDVID